MCDLFCHAKCRIIHQNRIVEFFGEAGERKVGEREAHQFGAQKEQFRCFLASY